MTVRCYLCIIGIPNLIWEIVFPRMTNRLLRTNPLKKRLWSTGTGTATPAVRSLLTSAFVERSATWLRDISLREQRLVRRRVAAGQEARQGNPLLLERRDVQRLLVVRPDPGNATLKMATASTTSSAVQGSMATGTRVRNTAMETLSSKTFPSSKVTGSTARSTEEARW